MELESLSCFSPFLLLSHMYRHGPPLPLLYRGTDAGGSCT